MHISEVSFFCVRVYVLKDAEKLTSGTSEAHSNVL